MEYNGFLLINKPQGLTSHQVVADLRRILGQRRIGHTGTLDPMATGVLPLALGKATKIIPYLDEEKKVYRARLVLGVSTDTQDLTGRVLSESPGITVPKDRILAAINKFTGVQEQVPPMYSAIKVQGQPLYKLAREGRVIPRKAREITVYHMEVCRDSMPVYRFKEGPELLIKCSKGTYIRTLCHDIGNYLGCGGCMGQLVRVSSGPFSLENAMTPEEVKAALDKGGLEEAIISPSRALGHLRAVLLEDENLSRVLHGNRIPAGAGDPEMVKGETKDGELIAVLKKAGEDGKYYWQPVRVLK